MNRTDVQALQSKASQLNSSTDNLNQVLLAAEEALKELRLGVTAEVPLWEDERDNLTSGVRCLRFGKWGNRWQLLVFTALSNDGETGHVHITYASRAERIQAASRMAALLVALEEEEVGLAAADVMEAKGTLLSFIDSLK